MNLDKIKTGTIRTAVRILGLIQLLMGILFWLKIADPLVVVHILLGCLVSLAMLLVIYRAKKAGIPLMVRIIALFWAYGLPAWGLLQARILPGSYNWISQVLHLLCGIGAVGLVEYLSARILHQSI